MTVLDNITLNDNMGYSTEVTVEDVKETEPLGELIRLYCVKHDKNTIKELINDKNYFKKAKVNPIEENENWKLK